MKPDYSLIADLAEFAAMTGKSFNEACLIAALGGLLFVRQSIGGAI